MSEDEISIDVRMEEKTDDGGSDRVHARLSVRVSDSSGSPLPKATITVSGKETDYQESKSAKDHGMKQTFENVPLPSSVLFEATGYEPISIDATESDVGGSITKGY